MTLRLILAKLLNHEGRPSWLLRGLPRVRGGGVRGRGRPAVLVVRGSRAGVHGAGDGGVRAVCGVSGARAGAAMNKTKSESPVMRLLGTVWEHRNTGTAHSWERVNAAMRKALELAIGSGFPFTVDDFKGLGEFRVGYWIGESSEWCYSLAVTVGNTSAAKAFEEWKGRAPVIADGVRPNQFDAGLAHVVGDRQQERLHVGAEFTWLGKKVTVTSFKSDGSVVACSYRKTKDDPWNRKVEKRFVITRDDVIRHRADSKERAKLHDELMKFVDEKKLTAASVLGELGIKTKSEFAALPVKRIQKVAERLRKSVA